MPDALEEVMDFIGRAAIGSAWDVFGRRQVERWMQQHPTHVLEAKRRIREAVKEGRL